MSSLSKPHVARAIVGVLLALVVGVGTESTTLAQHMGAQRTVNMSAAKSARVLKGGMSKAVVASGEVNLAKLPIAKPSAISPKPKATLTGRQLKTNAELASYQEYMASHPNLLPKGTSAPAPANGNLYHTGSIPVLQSHAAGLNSVDGGGLYPPDQAIAAAPSYVFEGVNNVLEVYNTSYSKVYGPWTPNTFFGPVYHPGDTMGDPQITYMPESGRKVFVISWLEITPSGNDYIDLAIDRSSSPNPLSNYNEFQIDPRVISGGSDDFCDYDTLGYDYYGLYITCIIYSISDGSFLGNTTFAFDISHMLTDYVGTWDYWYSVDTDISCGSGCLEPAYRVSPAMEDGFPTAEWVAASDAGFGVTSSNLTVCAITNTAAVGTGTLPTFTCGFNTLPLDYADPVGAAEPGTTATVYPGVGFKQIAYRSGQLYFAMPIDIDCSGVEHDGILWAAVTPQLTTLSADSPQFENGLYGNFTNTGYYCYSSADAYMPTIIASGESDMTLVFNYSSSSVYPSIVFTGRSNTDAPGTMGQTGVSKYVVSGSHSNDSGRWGDYSACSLLENGTSRGIVYCGGEFGGPHAALGGSGWDTELYSIRME